MKTDSLVETTIELQKPKMYKVLMHNDDYTTMEFVIEILMKVFHKKEQEAEMIMLEVHNQGKSVVGIFIYDIAITKKENAVRLAQQNGFPLKITIASINK